MLGKEIHFYYHSGTGNTLLVMKEMVGVFEKAGIQVDIHKIGPGMAGDIDTDVTIGLGFPVAFQSTFPFVWDFVNALPRSKGAPVFMVDTMMAYSGAIVGPMKKTLTMKGYDCIGAKEIKMPSNWLRKKIDEDKDKTIVERGKKEARSYARSLVHGKAEWKRIPILSDGFRFLCTNDFIMYRFILAEGKKIGVNKKKCKKCGLCAKLCPVGNIKMKEYPRWGNSCQLCQRCLNFCPAHAVSLPGKKFEQYNAVRSGEMLRTGIESDG